MSGWVFENSGLVGSGPGTFAPGSLSESTVAAFTVSWRAGQNESLSVMPRFG